MMTCTMCGKTSWFLPGGLPHTPTHYRLLFHGNVLSSRCKACDDKLAKDYENFAYWEMETTMPGPGLYRAPC